MSQKRLVDELREISKKPKEEKIKKEKVKEKKEWIRQEKAFAQQIIKGLPDKLKKVATDEENGGVYRVLYLGREDGEDSVDTRELSRGNRKKNLIGAGKIVYDWCVEQDLTAEVVVVCGCCVLEVSW